MTWLHENVARSHQHPPVTSAKALFVCFFIDNRLKAYASRIVDSVKSRNAEKGVSFLKGWTNILQGSQK